MKRNALDLISRPLFASCLLFAAACSSSGENRASDDNNINDLDELGTLSLPLSSHAASGTEYRLRNAEFTITSWWNYGSEPTTVSSEADPEAPSISINLPEGDYSVELMPGWELHKLENGEEQAVEATLLSGSVQYAFVQRRASSSAQFEFGIGEQSIWLNGDLNIAIQVYEDPTELAPNCYEQCDFSGCWWQCDGPFPGGAGGAGGATGPILGGAGGGQNEPIFGGAGGAR